MLPPIQLMVLKTRAMVDYIDRYTHGHTFKQPHAWRTQVNQLPPLSVVVTETQLLLFQVTFLCTFM